MLSRRYQQAHVKVNYMIDYILIPEKGKFPVKFLREELPYLRATSFILKTWKSKTALVDKKGGTIRLYSGKEFDENYFDLVENGWTHDHCEICAQDIRDGDEAYENEELDWVCPICYHYLIKPISLEAAFEKFNIKTE